MGVVCQSVQDFVLQLGRSPRVSASRKVSWYFQGHCTACGLDTQQGCSWVLGKTCSSVDGRGPSAGRDCTLFTCVQARSQAEPALDLLYSRIVWVVHLPILDVVRTDMGTAQ